MRRRESQARTGEIDLDKRRTVRYIRSMSTNKRATSYRLPDEARAMVVKMAKWRGVGQTSVVELAIRDSYARELAVARIRYAKGGAK